MTVMATMALEQSPGGLIVTAFDTVDRGAWSEDELREAGYLVPGDLVKNPAAVWEGLRLGDRSYLDPRLGVCISASTKKLHLSVPGLAGDALANVLRDFEFEAPDALAGGASPAEKPWYLRRFLGDWPVVTGSKQKVAVLDSGILPKHPLLPQATFLSLRDPKSKANDYNGHGSRCCGVIAGRGTSHSRASVAPGCRLIVGQHRGGNAGRVTAVDFVLLASWAIARKVRVISFSYGTSRQMVENHGDPATFATLARNARCNNLALIFCAAGRVAGPLYFPAAADGMVPVGGYVEDPCAPCGVVAATNQAGFQSDPARDFVLAPSNAVASIDPDGSGTLDFSGTSAACAFAAGLAALYFEAYPKSKVNTVLEKMQAQSRPVYDETATRWWRGLQFPEAARTSPAPC